MFPRVDCRQNHENSPRGYTLVLEHFIPIRLIIQLGLTAFAQTISFFFQYLIGGFLLEKYEANRSYSRFSNV